MKNQIDENRKKFILFLSLYICLYLLLKCAIFLYMIFARKKKTNKSNIKKVNCVLEFFSVFTEKN